MKTYFSNIQLNGVKYSANDLLAVCNKKEKLYSFDADEREVFLFIKNWLDDSDTIPVFTSGSTRQPKEFQLKKVNMISSALLTQKYFRLKSDHTVLLCLPVNYIAGKMMVVRAFVTGFNLLTVKPSSNPLKQVKTKIDFTAMTPHQLSYSMNDIDRLKIKKIIVGGGEIHPEIEKKVQNLSAEIFATYGMTETCSHVAVRKVNGKDASQFYQALSGITLTKDNRGCLIIHAPMLADREIITNDVVELTGDNFFRWSGRIDHVINSGGIKIYPEEIEKKLSGIIQYPFFISSIRDKILNEKIVLIIQKDYYTDSDNELLTKKMENVLSRFEMPKKIVCLKNFNFSDSGKILRKETMKQVL